jgi:hypothetical protein
MSNATAETRPHKNLKRREIGRFKSRCLKTKRAVAYKNAEN